MKNIKLDKVKYNIENEMIKKNRNTYISLFSSAGVGCFGFKEEEFQCVATNEFEEKRKWMNFLEMMYEK